MSFFKDRRQAMYPMIEDWSLPHNELRHENHKSMSDLIWFSPFMYKFMKIGLYIYFIIALAVLARFVIHGTIIQAIIGLLILFCMYKAFSEAYKLKGTDTNMYDIFLRDWGENNTFPK